MQYQVNDIDNTIAEFQKNNNATDRYASFDYCYYYFKQSSSEFLLLDIEKKLSSNWFLLGKLGHA